MTDVLAGLRASLTPRAEGYTVTELCALAKLPQTGENKDKVRAFLRGEIAGGRIRPQSGRRMAISGYPVAVPVYVPVAPKGKK